MLLWIKSPENRIFKIALAISFGIHILFLARVSYSKKPWIKKPAKKLEVTYETQAKVIAPPVEKKVNQFKPIQEQRLNNTKALLKTKSSNSAPLIKEMSKLSQNLMLDKNQNMRAESSKPMERKISVPELKSEKINNPVYLTYYEVVRNRIKEKAYQNFSKGESGEVYLTFVLFSNGTLKQIKFIEEKSKANDYLREVGLTSIKEASPFPSFPTDLKYPELSFNVVISFEVHNKE